MSELDREGLAAEMALGTLDAEERAAAERLAGDDADFAAAVAAWETRLAPLAEAVFPVAPPRHVWQHIERSLPHGDGAAVGQRQAPAALLERVRWKLAFWRLSAAAAATAALLFGVLWLGGVTLPFGARAPAEQYVALLNGDRGDSGFLVTVDAAAHRLLIRSLGAEPPEAKSYELWLMKDDGSVPLTLGIIEPGSFVTLDMDEAMPVDDWGRGLRLAVSLEPLGGAPSGRSMGPIVYAGNVMRQMP